MKIAILTDPIKNLNKKTDSTLYIYNALKNCEHNVQLFTQESITIDTNIATKITANCFQLSQQFTQTTNTITNLNQFDAILLRQDPPLNLNYATNVQMLNSLTKPKLINCPKTILTFPEKFVPLAFPQYMPETFVCRQQNEVESYVKRKKCAVLKSIHGHGGNEVILVNSNDIPNKIDSFMQKHTCVIVQEFLPNIVKGDKRVLMVNGKIFGVLRRTPKEGSILSNMVQGASGNVDTLNANEQKIASEVAQWLVQHNIFFAGLDLIDEKLIEVNITCPTGFKVYNDLTQNPHLQKTMVDELQSICRG